MGFCRTCKSYVIEENLLDIKKQLIAHFSDRHSRSPNPNPGDLLFPFNFEKNLSYLDVSSLPVLDTAKSFFSDDYLIAAITQTNYDSYRSRIQTGRKRKQQMCSLWRYTYSTVNAVPRKPEITREPKLLQRKKDKNPPPLVTVN